MFGLENLTHKAHTPYSPVYTSASMSIVTIRATSHTRLRARDHYTSSIVIDGKCEANPSLLHTTFEGQTEYVNAIWM
jgi:hypothetical protein